YPFYFLKTFLLSTKESFKKGGEREERGWEYIKPSKEGKRGAEAKHKEKGRERSIKAKQEGQRENTEKEGLKGKESLKGGRLIKTPLYFTTKKRKGKNTGRVCICSKLVV
ncbi:hypothetical protein QQP08_003727, partial [Theobroma cacao]